MHHGMCGCVCACLYKYSSLFHSVDSYFTWILTLLPPWGQTRQLLNMFLLLNILPFFLSRAQCYPTRALLCCRRLRPKPQPYLERTSHSRDEKEGNRCRGERAPCREPGFALIEGWLTRPSALWSSAWWRTGAVGVNNNVCLLYFVHCSFCEFVYIPLKKVLLENLASCLWRRHFKTSLVLFWHKYFSKVIVIMLQPKRPSLGQIVESLYYYCFA